MIFDKPIAITHLNTLTLLRLLLLRYCTELCSYKTLVIVCKVHPIYIYIFFENNQSTYFTDECMFCFSAFKSGTLQKYQFSDQVKICLKNIRNARIMVALSFLKYVLSFGNLSELTT